MVKLDLNIEQLVTLYESGTISKEITRKNLESFGTVELIDHILGENALEESPSEPDELPLEDE